MICGHKNMDVKLKPLSIIAIAIVCFVTLGLPNTYAQISVETDKSSYGITELIRVSGYIENFNISEPLTITLYQNDVYEIYSRTLEFRKAQGAAEYLLDGYFSTIIIPRDNIPLDWSGKYKVVATYQEQLYSTTFSFIGTDTLQGLSSMSEGGILQIDQKAYEIDQKPISINVDGIVRSIGGTDNFITISLFDEKNVIDFKQLEFSGPISLPDKIAAKLQHNNIIHNISTQFELPIDLPTGLYFIEMFSTKTSWTEREDLITELTGHAPPVDHINIPKIEFIVTNLSENQIISNASTIEPEQKLQQERDAYYESFENFQINYQNENDPNYYSSAP